MRSINPCTGTEMLPPETIVCDAIWQVAEAGQPYPLNLDFEMLIGCSSSSYAPRLVKQLEKRGLIKVVRFQRFRRLQIVATGEWTRKASNQKTTAMHVPKGCGAGSRSRGKVPVGHGCP